MSRTTGSTLGPVVRSPHAEDRRLTR